jgi:predicted GH43/DUF377 family glycosyl hydrolase
MKKITFLLILVMSTVLLVQAQTNEITWELVSEESISPLGEPGAWNSAWNEPGAAIYYDGQYHLFVNGFPGGIGTNNGIGYRISDDGVNYEWSTDEPILRRDDMPNDPLSIAATDVVVLEDGTWVLYFLNHNSASWPHIRATIGRATAPDPSGPWTVDEELVLDQGEEGAWDERSVAYATVTQFEDGFVMYYIGEDAQGVGRLGRATSQDGIAWEKDPEPVFELDRDLAENPSYVVSEVVYDGERWILAYKDNRASVGFAFSEDGIAWARYADNPVVIYSDIPGLRAIGIISFILDENGQGMLYMEGNIGGRSQVYAAHVTQAK